MRPVKIKMTKLQKKMFETLLRDPESKQYSDEDILALIIDIKKMNAAELQQNISIFKDTNRTLGYEI
jgi:hypothetical protein